MGGLDLRKVRNNLNKATFRIYIVGVLIILFFVVIFGTYFALNVSFGSVFQQYRSNVQRNLQRIVYEFDSIDGRIQLDNAGYSAPDIFGVPVFKIPLEYINVTPGHVEDIKPLLGCSFSSLLSPQDKLCVGILSNKALGAVAYVRGTFHKGNGLSSPVYIEDPRTGDYFLVEVNVRGVASKFVITFDEVNRQSSSKVPYLSPAWSLTGFKIGTRDRWAYSREPQIRGRALKVSDKIGTDRFEFIFQIPISIFADDAVHANQASDGAIWPPKDLSEARVSVKLIGKEANGESRIVLDSSMADPDTVFSFRKMGNYLTPGESLTFNLSDGSSFLVKHPDTDSPIVRQRFPFGILDRLTDLIIKVIVPKIQVNEVAFLPGGRSVAIHGDASSVLGGWRAAAQSIIMLSILLMIALIVAYVVLRVFVLTPLYRVRRNTLHIKERFKVGQDLTLPFEIKESQSEVGVLWRNILDLHEEVLAYSRSAVERAKSEQKLLQAIGHEIKSPLQDLLLRHNDESDPSARYVRRISFAVQNLYGGTLGQDNGDNLNLKTPQEAMSSLNGNITKEDVVEYLVNASESSVSDVVYVGQASSAIIMADGDMLESALTAILNNANDFRVLGTSIFFSVELVGGDVLVTVHNTGPCIPNNPIEEIFEYGVSARSGKDEHLGQGLYMANTYVSLMGGTLNAVNTVDGVRFEMRFPCVEWVPLGGSS
ncbi:MULTISPECIES: HAMP domain-containing sensor histidine kinase [unclassified Pseudomonas]|uniref:sensor histidine kinase n=1 Tax=unclassified Pseudomonas TaxID=196821 RepID=UPI002A362039|nr:MULTISPECIES: HAMP domain-containing sensor histidine kinase [unclassified Pseudomonas]MDX9669556.1 HAMP domain-containing sensor histidine kinase [Pseudomonas sp. P8_250]WPN36408.1 HAMP domain-containing sensor histidine kinase [Pseudomonas sp. P8_139]WPN41791.1 HAMP domain-containing sensor histidine kinase [Pseudomonas sp. P8_229]